jgi:hypothetical protein
MDIVKYVEKMLRSTRSFLEVSFAAGRAMSIAASTQEDTGRGSRDDNSQTNKEMAPITHGPRKRVYGVPEHGDYP